MDVVVIGIDIGTTNTKVGAYNLQGKSIALARRKMHTYRPLPEYSQYHPADIWENVCSCLQEIQVALKNYKVSGIGVSSMAESGVPLDKWGKPLFPIISWYDPRTEPQAQQMESTFGLEYLFRITGQYLHSKHGINKLLWFREHEPEAFDSLFKWLSMEDYIIYRLTGEFATDYSIAARTMAFDICDKKWSEEILSKIELSPELMPEVYEGGKVVGQVSKKAATETGLATGIPVVTGGHDHACAAIGVKIFEPGIILDSMGTAEAMMIAVEKPRLDREAFIQRISTYPHFGPLPYRVTTSMQASGGSIEWFLDAFGRELKHMAANSSKNVYEILMEEAAKSTFNASGLLYFPYIRGLVGYEYARGGFIGLKDSHGFKDFARAIIEGLAFEIRRQIEGFEDLFKRSYTNLRVVGGATKSAFWMQEKADILGRRVEVPVNEEAASFGAALLASVGTGLFSNEVEAAAHFYQMKAEYYPKIEYREKREKSFSLYNRCAKLFSDVFEDYDRNEMQNNQKERRK